MSSKRKTLTFNISEELFAEIQAKFPAPTGTQANLEEMFYAEKQISDLENLKAANLTTISSLESQIADLESEKSRLENLNLELENQNTHLENQLSQCENQVKTMATESAHLQEQLSSHTPLPEHAIVLECNALEHHLLSVVARKDKCTVKEMLVNRFFFMYQYRGPGDYNISLLKKDYLKRIRNTYENEE